MEMAVAAASSYKTQLEGLEPCCQHHAHICRKPVQHYGVMNRVRVLTGSGPEKVQGLKCLLETSWVQ